MAVSYIEASSATTSYIPPMAVPSSSFPLTTQARSSNSFPLCDFAEHEIGLMASCALAYCIVKSGRSSLRGRQRILLAAQKTSLTPTTGRRVGPPWESAHYPWRRHPRRSESARQDLRRSFPTNSVRLRPADRVLLMNNGDRERTACVCDRRALRVCAGARCIWK